MDIGGYGLRTASIYGTAPPHCAGSAAAAQAAVAASLEQARELRQRDVAPERWCTGVGFAGPVDARRGLRSARTYERLGAVPLKTILRMHLAR